MSKIYISAPITGYDLKERKGYFAYIANKVRALGHEPANPMADVDINNPRPKEEYMRKDLKMLLDCDAILFNGKWRGSEGCKIESIVAHAIGLKQYVNNANNK